MKNLFKVQNIKTGGVKPKLEVFNWKKLIALGLPKTRVLLSQNSSFHLNCENLWNHQNWQCCLKTGGFVFWKLGFSLPDQNSRFAPPKLEFSPLSENLVKIFETSKLEVLVQDWQCSCVEKSVLCVTHQNSSFELFHKIVLKFKTGSDQWKLGVLKLGKFKCSRPN